MIWEGINNRKFPRVSYKCLIRVSRDGREEVIDTFTENVGAGGICVVLERDFGLFETVSMEIFMSDDESPIFCNGTIVWVVRQRPASPWDRTRYDTGIEFMDISEEDRGHIAQLVRDILEPSP